MIISYSHKSVGMKKNTIYLNPVLLWSSICSQLAVFLPQPSYSRDVVTPANYPVADSSILQLPHDSQCVVQYHSPNELWAQFSPFIVPLSDSPNPSVLFLHSRAREPQSLSVSNSTGSQHHTQHVLWDWWENKPQLEYCKPPHFLCLSPIEALIL